MPALGAALLAVAGMTVIDEAPADGAPASPAAAVSTPACRDGHLPVSLGAGQPAAHQVFVRLCLPAAGPPPTTVQVLVHGFSYDHTYWDFPDPTGGTDRYSYVAAATDAGHATLSLDRLGVGRSSHPLSLLVTTDAQAWVVHQVVQALRSGTIPGSADSPSFSRVVSVGHSLGTGIASLEASRYDDVDALVLTGGAHQVSLPTFVTTIGLSLQPAGLDPRFPHLLLDPGYLTTRAGTRGNFHASGGVDPAVVALDEATKETGTAAELASVATSALSPLDIRVPVLVVAGAADALVCTTPASTASDCSSDAALAADEAPYLGPQVPCVDGYVLTGAGHDVNLALTARAWFAAAQSWLGRHATPSPDQGPACAAPGRVPHRQTDDESSRS